MADIEAITKSRNNSQQNFKFRGIDDVYNEIHSILAKHKVFTVPCVVEERTEERTTKSGSNLIYRVIKMQYTFYAEDGSHVYAAVMGEGMDSGDKACNKAMSVAHKYALLQTFCIPTEDEKDPDGHSPEQSKPKAKKSVDQIPQHGIFSQANATPGDTGNGEDVISSAQRQRLFAIMSEAGKTSDQVKVILAAHGYDSSSKIHRKDYDIICKEVQGVN